jgi:hypothetical protein
MLLIQRCMILVDFGFKYTDSDQAIMWAGLIDYSKGIFHEPRFYGQNYSTMLEALFAVPLYYFGLPPYKALPIVTSLITLAPFIAIALACYKRRALNLSLIILSIPLFLPAEYSLISTIPRGFVGGVFIAGLGVVAGFYSSNRNFFLTTFAGVIAFSINSNSVILSFPSLLFLLLENNKNRNFYVYSAYGVIAGLIIHLIVNFFYIIHPFYDLHKLVLDYSFERMLNNLRELDQFFNYVTPFFWSSGFIILVFFLIIALALIREKKINAGIAVFCVPFLITLSLGLNKVLDGSTSIYWPYARMFLAIPPLFGLTLSFLNEPRAKILRFWIILPLIYFTYHMVTDFKTIVVKARSGNVVSISKVTSLLDSCQALKKVSNKFNAELIIINHCYLYDALNYGCAACVDNFPKTLRPEYERRTWRLLEDEKRIYKTVLLVEEHRKMEKEFIFVKKIKFGLYVIENNKLNTMDLLDSLKVYCRPFK